MKCKQAGIGKLCVDCPHNEEHNRTRHCGYSKCTVYAVAFGKDNQSCLQCIYREECQQYKDLQFEGKPFINLITHGDDCPQYRRRYLYARCQ